MEQGTDNPFAAFINTLIGIAGPGMQQNAARSTQEAGLYGQLQQQAAELQQRKAEAHDLSQYRTDETALRRDELGLRGREVSLNERRFGELDKPVGLGKLDLEGRALESRNFDSDRDYLSAQIDRNTKVSEAALDRAAHAHLAGDSIAANKALQDARIAAESIEHDKTLRSHIDTTAISTAMELFKTKLAAANESKSLEMHTRLGALGQWGEIGYKLGTLPKDPSFDKARETGMAAIGKLTGLLNDIEKPGSLSPSAYEVPPALKQMVDDAAAGKQVDTKAILKMFDGLGGAGTKTPSVSTRSIADLSTGGDMLRTADAGRAETRAAAVETPIGKNLRRAEDTAIGVARRDPAYGEIAAAASKWATESPDAAERFRDFAKREKLDLNDDATVHKFVEQLTINAVFSRNTFKHGHEGDPLLRDPDYWVDLVKNK